MNTPTNVVLELNPGIAVLPQLDSVLQQHAGEYVKLVGVDPQAKRRLAEVIVQRPGDDAPNLKMESSFNHRSSNNNNGFSNKKSGRNRNKNNFDSDVSGQISSLINQG